MLLKTFIFIKELFPPSYVLNFYIKSNNGRFVQNLEKILNTKEINLKKTGSKTYCFKSQIRDVTLKHNFLKLNFLEISCQVEIATDSLIEISVRLLIGWVNNLVGYYMFGMVAIGLFIQDFELMKLILFLALWIIIINLYYMGMVKSNYKDLELFFRSAT